MHRPDKYSQYRPIISPVLLGLMLVYELSGSGFESRCSHFSCFYSLLKYINAFLSNVSFKLRMKSF